MHNYLCFLPNEYRLLAYIATNVPSLPRKIIIVLTCFIFRL